MKSANGWVTYGFNDMRLQEVPYPRCRPGWAIVRTRVVQPSVTEVQLFYGERSNSYDKVKKGLTAGPMQLFGHEFYAEVVEVESGNGFGLSAGDRVGATHRDLGTIGRDFPGCFSEYAAVPLDALAKIPEGISDWEAAASPARPRDEEEPFMRRLVIALFFLLYLGSACGARAQERIRIGYSSVNIHAALVWMAEKRGLYNKYGLSSQLIFMPGGSTNVQALVSGSVDLSQLTAPPGIAANLEGADIVYIAGTDDRMAYQLITRPEIKKVADLRGAKLGISRFGSAADFSLRLVLKKLGLDPARDVAILQVGSELARVAALKTGAIDGTLVNAPYGSEAMKQNFNLLADAGKMDIVYFGTGICGSRRLLAREQGKVLDFMRAYLETIKIFKTERDYTVKMLSQFTKIDDRKVVEEGYDYFKDRIPRVPYPSLEAMRAVVSQMAEGNPKAKAVQPASYISDRFIKRLDEQGFVKKLWAR